MDQVYIKELDELQAKHPDIWRNIAEELDIADPARTPSELAAENKGDLTSNLMAETEELKICKVLLNIKGNGTVLGYLLAIALGKVE